MLKLSRQLSLKDQGQTKTITVIVGPVIPDENGDWVCQIEAPSLLPSGASSKGVDALQAFIIGIQILHRTVLMVNESGYFKIWWLEENDNGGFELTVAGHAP